MKNYIFAFLLNAFVFAISMLMARTVYAHPVQNTNLPVLADLKVLQDLQIPVFYKDEKLGVAMTYLSPEQQARVHTYSHSLGRCGAFESLENHFAPATIGAKPTSAKQVTLMDNNYFDKLVSSMRVQQLKENMYVRGPFKVMSQSYNAEIEKAAGEVSETELKKWLDWFSAFPTRFNKSGKANVHVDELYNKLTKLVQDAPYKVTVTKISHNTTPQKSLRVRIEGKSRPDEIVVLGGHYDSINMYGGANGRAPGVDDNASGSANLLEALRIVLQRAQPERSIEFFWYAGEESGLLGSAEIAEDYKNKKKNVIAVMQLDMTLNPGDGELVIGNFTDFTSAWLRDYFKDVNDLYLKAKLVEDKCGYGCSDHASWYRQGYSTFLPFEATFDTINPNIHTPNDVFNSTSSLKHTAAFAKLAVIFALDFGNNKLKSL